jgi:hypothetical protein
VVVVAAGELADVTLYLLQLASIAGIVIAIRDMLNIPVKFVGLGETPDDIAERLDYTPGAARKLVTRAIAAAAASAEATALDIRRRQLAGIDEAIAQIARLMLSGSSDLKLKAADRLVRLWERQAKLTGADLAEPAAPPPTYDATIAGLLATARAQLAQRERDLEANVDADDH